MHPSCALTFVSADGRYNFLMYDTDYTLRPFVFPPPKFIIGRCIQDYTTYKGFGPIWKKPEIYALPLKRKPIWGDKSMEAVIDRMPAMDKKIHEDGKEIPLYKGKNVH
jgi:hypothetical protein